MKGIPLCLVLGAMLWALIINVIIAWPSELGRLRDVFIEPAGKHCMMSARHGVEIWMGKEGTYARSTR